MDYPALRASRQMTHHTQMCQWLESWTAASHTIHLKLTLGSHAVHWICDYPLFTVSPSVKFEICGSKQVTQTSLCVHSHATNTGRVRFGNLTVNCILRLANDHQCWLSWCWWAWEHPVQLYRDHSCQDDWFMSHGPLIGIANHKLSILVSPSFTEIGMTGCVGIPGCSL